MRRVDQVKGLSSCKRANHSASAVLLLTNDRAGGDDNGSVFHMFATVVSSSFLAGSRPTAAYDFLQ